MSHRYDYKNRLPLNLISDKTIEVLPEHYATEYPNLVKFLDIYNEYLEKDDEGFSYLIQGLYQVRDLNSTQLSSLDNIFKEIGNNSSTADYFADPRFIAKVISSFYSAKGSKISAEGFFRAFFGEEANVVYPKRDIFIINESRIGPDSVKYIQDAERYQIHSILIQSGIPLSKWKELFKVFVHPAGWYLSGDVAIESVIDLGLGTMPLAIQDSAAGLIILEDMGLFSFNPITSVTTIVNDDTDSDLYAERLSTRRTLSLVETIQLSVLNQQYNSLIELFDENSPKFDEDSGSGAFVDLSNTLETMDQNIFDYWDSDQNVFHYQDSA